MKINLQNITIMKKYFLTLAVAFLAATTITNAQTAPVTPAAVEEAPIDSNAAFIEVESTTVDYGTINKGDDPLRILKFKNTGKSPLIITNCQGSCGCTVPECPKDPIMPGETGELKIRYDTKRVGKFFKTVTIKSNAANTPVTIQVKGVVLDVKTPDAFPANDNQGPVTK